MHMKKNDFNEICPDMLNFQVTDTSNGADSKTEEIKNTENEDKKLSLIVEELRNGNNCANTSDDDSVNELVEKYDITAAQAKECITEAQKADEEESKAYGESQTDDKKFNSYFYPSGYDTKKDDDGMNSLTSLSDYNRLMFLGGKNFN